MLKLKMFRKKDKSAASAPVSAEVEEETSEETTEETTEETETSEETEAAEETEEASEEATLSEVVTQMNACTEVIEGLQGTVEAQAATNKELTDKITKLEGSREKEIDQAASKKAITQTAAQGVPAAELPEGEGEGAMDEPKSYNDFINAYNGIADPSAAGKYHAKWSNKFGQK